MREPLIYGAYGYTGELVVARALECGLRPILAGRNATAVEALATRNGLAHRAFALDDPDAIDRGLDGVSAVAHCAGPFSRTARPMAEACLRRGVHYLDITGEIAVFEALAALDAGAKAAGVTLLPGSGFDVVPSDSLAAHLARRLPGATSLALGFQSTGTLSRGTATTMVENLHRGGMVRRGGRLTPVPSGWRARTIDFGAGPTHAMTIPWGDVSAAFHSTGIPDIEVYLAVPPRARTMARLSNLVRPLLGTRPVQSLLLSRVRAGAPGPSAERRDRSACLLWGEATDGRRRVVSRQRTPDGYTHTAHAAVAILERLLQGSVATGFQTPSRAFGPDFVLGLPGVSRSDDPMEDA